MKIEQLFEQNTVALEPQKKYVVNEIQRQNREELQKFAEIINAAPGQQSWKLTPQRLIKKIGVKGGIYGLYVEGTSELVGGVLVKQVEIDALQGGEISYFVIQDGHRNIRNVVLLYKAALTNARKFDILYATTNVKNRAITKLLDRTPKMERSFIAKSPLTRNLLQFWISTISNMKYTMDERDQALRTKFADIIVRER